LLAKLILFLKLLLQIIVFNIIFWGFPSGFFLYPQVSFSLRAPSFRPPSRRGPSLRSHKKERGHPSALADAPFPDACPREAQNRVDNPIQEVVPKVVAIAVRIVIATSIMIFQTFLFMVQESFGF
jgi:hypothetical protein